MAPDSTGPQHEKKDEQEIHEIKKFHVNCPNCNTENAININQWKHGFTCSKCGAQVPGALDGVEPTPLPDPTAK